MIKFISIMKHRQTGTHWIEIMKQSGPIGLNPRLPNFQTRISPCHTGSHAAVPRTIFTSQESLLSHGGSDQLYTIISLACIVYSDSWMHYLMIRITPKKQILIPNHVEKALQNIWYDVSCHTLVININSLLCLIGDRDVVKLTLKIQLLTFNLPAHIWSYKTPLPHWQSVQ